MGNQEGRWKVMMFLLEKKQEDFQHILENIKLSMTTKSLGTSL